MTTKVYALGQNPEDWPTELPRFAQSFRTIIMRSDWDEYLLTGDWADAVSFPRHRDFCLHLREAGRLRFITCTKPVAAHKSMRDWYGDNPPPSIYWHWDWATRTWKIQNNQASVEDFCIHCKTSIAVFNVPRNQDVPFELWQH